MMADEMRGHTFNTTHYLLYRTIMKTVCGV